MGSREMWEKGLRSDFKKMKLNVMRERDSKKKAFEVKRKRAIGDIEGNHKRDIEELEAWYHAEMNDINADEAAAMAAGPPSD
jgi:hypothetical protein